MCPIKRETTSAESGSPCSSSTSTSSSSEHHQTAWASPPKKRPAGRTKFRETRHPVFRGVRRRGRAGRWVCEVRVPGRRGCRLWLGTFDAAEAAARAHDAAMLAVAAGAARLNFADSAWLLAVPTASYASLADVRRAVTEAVESFLRLREEAAVEEEGDGDALSAASSTSANDKDGDESSSATTTDDDSPFELDMFGGMSWDLYYANLAQAMLVEPPPIVPALCDDGVASELPLWSY
jgi:hypothetical protein